jgi:hypothetical protein
MSSEQSGLNWCEFYIFSNSRIHNRLLVLIVNLIWDSNRACVTVYRVKLTRIIVIKTTS